MSRLLSVPRAAFVVMMICAHPYLLGAGNLPVCNVRDFGAVPNDSLDDRTAIQNAVNTCISQGTTSIVYFPGGTWDLSGDISVTAPLTIAGSGSRTTTIRTLQSNTTSNMFSVVLSNTTTGVWLPVAFRDLGFATAAIHSAGTTIYFSNTNAWSNGLRVENVYFGSSMPVNLWIDMAGAFVVDRCFFQGATGNEMWVDNSIDSDVNDGVISNSYFYQAAPDPYAAILHVGGGGLKISGNKFIGYQHHYANWMSIGAAEQPTGILHFTNNSSEQGSVSNLLFAGDEIYDAILIQNNDFSVGRRSDFACTSASAGIRIETQAGGSHKLGLISGNIFRQYGAEPPTLGSDLPLPG